MKVTTEVSWDTTKDWRKVESTQLQGYVEATYEELEDLLGQPLPPADYKTQAEWIVVFSDGVAVSIYDWKSSVPFEQVTTWNVGGRNKEAVSRVKQLLVEG